MTAIVPATSANVGCAFDCAAIALNLHLKAEFAASDAPGFQISYTGQNADRVPLDDSNLVLQSFLRTLKHYGRNASGGHIAIESEIPVGVGLGSSAAAIVAGILLGTQHCEVEIDPRIVLRLAVEMEGHPDNVTAAYHGGFVVAASVGDPAEVLAAKAPVPGELDFIVVTPNVPIPTSEARAILPKMYSRADIVSNLQRALLLAAQCFSGKFDLTQELFRDRLHQPYRSRLIPGLGACLDVQHPGLVGVFVSGAGSSVLAIARQGAEEIAELLADTFRREGVESEKRLLKADNRGALLTTRAAGTPGADPVSGGKHDAKHRKELIGKTES